MIYHQTCARHLEKYNRQSENTGIPPKRKSLKLFCTGLKKLVDVASDENFLFRPGLQTDQAVRHAENMEEEALQSTF